MVQSLGCARTVPEEHPGISVTFSLSDALPMGFMVVLVAIVVFPDCIDSTTVTNSLGAAATGAAGGNVGSTNGGNVGSTNGGNVGKTNGAGVGTGEINGCTGDLTGLIPKNSASLANFCRLCCLICSNSD